MTAPDENAIENDEQGTEATAGIETTDTTDYKARVAQLEAMQSLYPLIPDPGLLKEIADSLSLGNSPEELATKVALFGKLAGLKKSAKKKDEPPSPEEEIENLMRTVIKDELSKITSTQKSASDASAGVGQVGKGAVLPKKPDSEKVQYMKRAYTGLKGLLNNRNISLRPE